MSERGPTKIDHANGPSWWPLRASPTSHANPTSLAISTSPSTALVLLIVLLITAGCRLTKEDAIRGAARLASLSSKQTVKVKKLDRVDRLGPVRRLVTRRPLPSERTLLFLRNNNLQERHQLDPAKVVRSLEREFRFEPSMATSHAIAELAQLEGDWNLRTDELSLAARHYATAVVHAYQFLFDDKLDVQRNAFDPQFREICDIYNHSLENLLRIFCSKTNFQSGSIHQFGNGNDIIEIDVVTEGRWKKEEFESFQLVNDFEIKGIDNHYRTFGLGVPLIAVRKPTTENASSFERYYPPSLSVPMTAFLEVVSYDESSETHKATLRLFDPQQQTVIKTKSGIAPLESDLTAPMAYYLHNPLLNSDLVSTASLLDANIAANYYGFYMLEPFDPEKIPVVMVHGLWSSPVTWMKMFNDLNSNAWIRQKYQFWFYMYPTGQPFWISAAEMREDLRQLRYDVDAAEESAALKEMVLVGHSMGGLVSRMQTVSSGESFWGLISDYPLEEMRGSDESIRKISDLVYFDADPNISRVVTIATPHQGSRSSNNFTRWLSHKVFTLPTDWTSSVEEFLVENRDLLKADKKIMIPTSVDSLAPDSPFMYGLSNARVNSKTVFHNIIGNETASQLTEAFGNYEPGDGVVSIESADLKQAVSSITVESEHVNVHRHPQTILEVKRILLQNLVDTGRIAADHAILRASYQNPVEEVPSANN